MAPLYDDIPDMVRKDIGNGIELVSECTGMRIEIVNKDGRDHFTLRAPAFDGEDAWTFGTADWDDMLATYGDRWLRWVAVTIGLGFHPDTSAGHYQPPLPEPLRSEYDDMIGFIFEFAPGDPYGIGLDAWQKGGFIEADPDNDALHPAPGA